MFIWSQNWSWCTHFDSSEVELYVLLLDVAGLIRMCAYLYFLEGWYMNMHKFDGIGFHAVIALTQ